MPLQKIFRIMHEAIHPETKMVAVIKTDGYGHGAVPIAQMIQPEDYIWGFAVATMTEAMILRKNQITKPVLILGYTFEEDYEDLIRYEIRPIVFKLDMAKKLIEAGCDEICIKDMAGLLTPYNAEILVKALKKQLISD